MTCKCPVMPIRFFFGGTTQTNFICEMTSKYPVLPTRYFFGGTTCKWLASVLFCELGDFLLELLGITSVFVTFQDSLTESLHIIPVNQIKDIENVKDVSILPYNCCYKPVLLTQNWPIWLLETSNDFFWILQHLCLLWSVVMIGTIWIKLKSLFVSDIMTSQFHSPLEVNIL